MLRNRVAISVITGVLLTALNASATLIDLGAGWSAQVPDNVSIANIRISETAVTIDILKDLARGLDEFNEFTPIIIAFYKSAAGPKNLVIDKEIVTNLTGVAWIDYHLFLSPYTVGFDTAAGTPDGSPFNNVAFGGFDGLNGLPVQLNFAAGIVPHQASFRPGEASGDIVITTIPGQTANFILKQVPTIPEPATLLLFACAGLGIKRRKKI